MEALMLLDSRQRGQLTAPLLALNPENRSDRFIGAVSDGHVRRDVDGIGYARDVLIGALQGRRLLASIPPNVPRSDDLRHEMAELCCDNSRVALQLALADAQDVDVSAAAKTPVVVFGGTRDRVVPNHRVRDTARRYGVEPRLIEGGHRLMLERAANDVIEAFAA